MANMRERVWILEELNILHTMDNPVIIFTAGIVEDPHSARGVRDSFKCIFRNTECLSKVGSPRTQEEYSQTIAGMPSDKQRFWYDWVRKIMGYTKQEDWSHLHEILEPVLDVSKADRTVRVVSKPIKIKLRHQVETAIMCQIKTDHDKFLTRLAAMDKRNPLYAFMFARDGTLLFTNDASLRKYGGTCIDDCKLQLKDLFLRSDFPGGQAEAQAAYEEAVDACYNLKLDSHRHAIPRISSKTGRHKWSMVEMWPMTDPVTGHPAMMAFVHNITQQKQVEMQLAQHQEVLQRENQDLEQNRIQMERQTAAIQLEKDALQQAALDLAQRLEAVIHDKFMPKSHIDADTPIDKTLNFLHAFVAGENPSVQSALDIYHILIESDTDLRQPVGLKTQLLKRSSMDTEVGMSMLQLLTGPAAHREGTPVDVASPPLTKSLSRQISILKPTDRCLRVLVSQEPVSASITPQVERMLQDAESNWQFDVFAFAEQTGPSIALSVLSFFFFQKYGVMEGLKPDSGKLATWVRTIELGYDAANPYHNSIHVASVVQMTHMLMHHGGVAKVMTTYQVFATYYAALIHDFEHLGVNNDYLIKTFHPLAVMYNDQSPLENHHIAAAVRLMLRPECNFTGSDNAVNREGLSRLRPVIVQQVLGTDMKKHFDILSRFQTAFKRSSPTSAPDAASANEGVETSGKDCSVSGEAPTTDVIDWDSVKPDDKCLVLQMLLKCADIGHLAAEPEVHKKWAYQLEEEFFQQGDREKEVGLPVSPLMDRRHKGGITRSQMGFFNIVGLPMFKAMVDVFEGARPMLEGVMANYRSWEAAAAAADLSSA